MKTLLALIIITALSFLGCKKCKVCDSYKNGKATTAKNCAYEAGSYRTLNTWVKMMQEDKSYDSVICRNE